MSACFFKPYHQYFDVGCFWPLHPISANRTICYLGGAQWVSSGCCLRPDNQRLPHIIFILVGGTLPPVFGSKVSLFVVWTLVRCLISILHFFCQRNVGHCCFQWFSVVHCGSSNHSNGLCAFSMVWKGNVAGKQRKPRNLCSDMSITNGYQWFPTNFLAKKSFKTWNPNDECSNVAPRTVLFGPTDLGFNLLWGWQRCVECERPLVEFPQRKKSGGTCWDRIPWWICWFNTVRPAFGLHVFTYVYICLMPYFCGICCRMMICRIGSSGFEQHNQTQHAAFFCPNNFCRTTHGGRSNYGNWVSMVSRDDPPLRPSTAASSTFSKVPGLWIEMGRGAKSPQNSLAPIGLFLGVETYRESRLHDSQLPWKGRCSPSSIYLSYPMSTP